MALFLPVAFAVIAGGSLYLSRNQSQSDNDAHPQIPEATPAPDSISAPVQTAPSQAPRGSFIPRPVDVFVVKAMLLSAKALPPEIMDMIIDHAEYWPRTVTSMAFSGANTVRIRGGGRHGTENQLLLRTAPIGFPEAAVADMSAWRAAPSRFSTQDATTSDVPLEHFKSRLDVVPALEHPVRKVVFKIRSKDQGWGGSLGHRNTFRGSWTWFEAGLERFEGTEAPEPFEPSALRAIYPVPESVTETEDGQRVRHRLDSDERLTVQRNRTAARAMADYEIAWYGTDSVEPESLEAEELEQQGRGRASATGAFVRDLRLGDVITLWGKARFANWVNHVEKASVEVYWSV